MFKSLFYKLFYLFGLKIALLMAGMKARLSSRAGNAV